MGNFSARSPVGEDIKREGQRKYLVILTMRFAVSLYFLFGIVASVSAIDVPRTFTSCQLRENYGVFPDTSKLLTVNDVAHISPGLWRISNQRCFVEVFDDFAYWVKIPLRKTTGHASELVLDIAFSDINDLSFYFIKSGRVHDSILTGDYRQVASRQILANDFAFPVDLQKDDTLAYVYLRAYNHAETLVLPMVLYEKTAYMRQKASTNFLWGIYFCSAFVFIFLAAVSWTFVRTGTYLYYIFYLLSLFMFLFSQKGFAYLILYPLHPFLQNVANPFWVGAFTFLALLFGREFVELKTYHPRLYRLNVFLTYCTGIFIVAMVFVMNLPQSIVNVVQTLYLSLLFIDGIILIVCGLISSWVQRKLNCYLYLLAYSVVTSGFGVFYLMFFKVLPGTPLTINIIYITSMAEMLIFSTYLTLQINISRSKRLQTMRAYQQEQKLRLLGLFLGEEKERKRISLELHDGLGVLLSTIKNRLALFVKDRNRYADQYEMIGELIAMTSKEIDAVCNSLFTEELKNQDIVPLIGKTLDGINKNDKQIEFCLRGDAMVLIPDKNKRINLFRILQELINNIYKHSGATQAEIFIQENEGKTILVVSDNGTGFDFFNLETTGIGIKNIIARVELFGGMLGYENREGSIFTIEIA